MKSLLINAARHITLVRVINSNFGRLLLLLIIVATFIPVQKALAIDAFTSRKYSSSHILFYDDDCMVGDMFSGSVFDLSKLNLYEEVQKGQADPGAGYDWARGEAGRNYAINDLQIPISDIKIYDKAEVENMIMAETARQFNALPDKYNSTVDQAQRAILSYQEHEDASFQLFAKNLRNDTPALIPSHTDWGNDSYPFRDGTINIMSLTWDKFRNENAGGKNKRTAASFDIKYTIYLGVKENMTYFQNPVLKGSGEDRWKATIGAVFEPGDIQKSWDTQCYWIGAPGKTYCRYKEANEAWAHYAVLPGGAGGFYSQCSADLGTGIQAVVNVAKQEYEKNNGKLAFNGSNIAYPGSDYSNGVIEHWCADFVSWVYKQAGIPFTDGQDGWLIRGVSGLIDYFKNKQIFIALGQGDPQPGDAILYYANGEGKHVQIVIGYDSATKTVTYIGGNECNGMPGCNHPYSTIVQTTFVIGGAGQRADLVGFGRYKQ